MKAYKVFNPDWKCKNFQYEVGKTYEIDEKPILCKKGFHACIKAADCFSYYSFDPKNKVAEVELLGDIDGLDGDKQCTNKIKIVKEISWQEILVIVNTGNNCTGLRNSGDCNSGNCNSGDCNSGNWNSGDCNSGNWNSGNWNSGNCNSGFFNTDKPKIRIFNKYTDFENISFPSFLCFDPTVWVSHDTATDEEKEKYKTEIETCGGFLKTIDYKTAFKIAYDKASTKEIAQLKALPNFDKNIFFEISGIMVD